MHKVFTGLVLAASLAAFSGCAATGVALSKRHLDVQTKMSDSVFLDPPAPQAMVALLQIRNTSDKPDFSIQYAVENALSAKGWRITRNPDEAQYLLQVNILQVGKTDQTAADAMLHQGYGVGNAAVAGAGLAYASGSTSGRGIVGAGLAVGAADFIAGQLVKDVYFSAITDVQISQRSKTAIRLQGQQSLAQGNSGAENLSYSEESNWKRYRTRVLSSANKVNLDWNEAQPELVKGLATAISGML